MGMSGSWGPSDDDESVKVLNKAIDVGCTFWDTAYVNSCQSFLSYTDVYQSILGMCMGLGTMKSFSPEFFDIGAKKYS